MRAIAEKVTQAGGTVPPPVSGLALIDTGAYGTAIDTGVAQAIGAPVIDVVTMHSATHAAHPTNVYPVHFEMVGLPMALDCPRALGANLRSQGIIMLIGRDMLRHCILVYNGPTGQFTLAL
jgi:predicted aspartyl protease